MPMTEKQLWGGETTKAVENFPISGERVPVSVVHWLARIKGAAALVNGELGLLDKRRAARIEKAAGEIAAGKHDEQFPIDVFQTGSGTSTNTNANEVIARARRRRACTPTTTSTWASPPTTCSPRPSISPRSTSPRTSCCRRCKQLERSFAKKAKSFQNVVKSGRTHLMDAVPVTLGQEFGGYAAQIALGQERVRSALVARRADPARRHRHRHRPEHPPASSPRRSARA